MGNMSMKSVGDSIEQSVDVFEDIKMGGKEVVRRYVGMYVLQDRMTEDGWEG